MMMLGAWDYGKAWCKKFEPLIAAYRKRLIAKGVKDGTRKMDKLLHRKFPRSGGT